MESTTQATPPAAELDARDLFAARLAALTGKASEAENLPVKKRGTLLMRRFFGGRDREIAVGAAPEPQEFESNPPDQPGNGTVSVLPVSQENEALTDRVDPQVTAVVGTAAAEDAPPPRISVPPFQPLPTIMTPIQTTPHSPAAGRASAQLTLAFEITSLQLTPFFRLGSVQLKTLSNVVALGLVAAGQGDQPLAAGISFEIERVELDDAARLKSLLLKPLGESRAAAVPQSKFQVGSVAVAGEAEDAPISVTGSGAAPTAVQLIGMFAIAALDFSPAFEIDSLRLEPVSGTVLLRVASSSDAGAQDLPSSFEIAAVQLGDGGQISGVRLGPNNARDA